MECLVRRAQRRRVGRRPLTPKEMGDWGLAIGLLVVGGILIAKSQSRPPRNESKRPVLFPSCGAKTRRKTSLYASTFNSLRHPIAAPPRQWVRLAAALLSAFHGPYLVTLASSPKRLADRGSLLVGDRPWQISY